MKNIILTLLLFCGFASYGQIMQTNNTPGGYQWKAMKSDSMTIITHGADTLAIGPAKYGVATIGAIYYKTTDSSLWLRSAHKWNQLSGSGGGLSAGDTVYLHSRLVASYGKNAGNDSTILILNDGTRFAAMDNSGSSVTWGDILGDIHNQTDLINYIDSVFNVAASDSDHLVGVWPIVQTRSNDTIYTALDSTFMTVTLIDGIKSGGFVSWTGTGLTFDITPVTYVKNGVLYSLGATQITLSPADPDDPRYDVPAVDNTPGYDVVEGDAEANPVIPQVAPATQLPLTSILIPAGATEPGVTVETIYDEDSPPEWTHTTTATVGFSNTTNPKHLTIAADMSAYISTRTMTFTHTGNLDRLDYTLLKFYIDLKTYLPATSNIQVRFYNGNTAVTPALTLSAAHGFTKVDVGYQTITVPLSSLAFSSNTFTRIVFTFTGSGSGLYFDWAQLQGGIDPGGTPTTGTVTQVNTGLGLTGGPINTIGTVSLDTASASVISRQRAAATYVPLTRNITINGVTYDLSADRSWTVSVGTTLTYVKSLLRTGDSVALVNDQTTPGNNKVYGTSASGVKGWQPTAIIDGTGGVLGDVVTYDGSGYILTSVFKEYSFTATYGQSTYTDALLSGRHIRVWREGFLQTTTQASLSGSTITFSPALAANERVYIETNLKAVW